MGILLLGPAWTLDFRQAWLYLFVFGASAALITGYLWMWDPKLLERRVNAGPAAEKRGMQKIVQLLASLSFIAILVVSSLDHRFSWSEVPFPATLAGEGLVALGFLIVFAAFRANTFAAATVDLASDQRVVSSGPYALVRHPMYSGALVMLLGTPIALGSWWGMLALGPIALVIVWRLLDEERFLTSNLQGYAEYCRRVRFRLLPLVW